MRCKMSTSKYLRTALAALAAIGLAPALVIADTANTSDDANRHVYYTGGVHNDKDCTPADKCLYARNPGEPTDPLYPVWWSSEWVMYRVFRNYDKYPPPYTSPPTGLTPDDYQVSFGATYYNSTYFPP